MGEKVAIYARVSTEDQAEKQTIDIQLRDCRMWVKREGHIVAGEFKDEGVSGATPFDERPGGSDLLAKASDFDRVVFYSVDRLARDTVEGGLALKAFKHARIAVTFVTIQLDLETKSGAAEPVTGWLYSSAASPGDIRELLRFVDRSLPLTLDGHAEYLGIPGDVQYVFSLQIVRLENLFHEVVGDFTVMSKDLTVLNLFIPLIAVAIAIGSLVVSILT